MVALRWLGGDEMRVIDTLNIKRRTHRMRAVHLEILKAAVPLEREKATKLWRLS